MGAENVGLIIMKTDGGGGGELFSHLQEVRSRSWKISRGSSLHLTGNLSPSDLGQEPSGRRLHFRHNWIDQIFTSSPEPRPGKVYLCLSKAIPRYNCERGGAPHHTPT